MAYDVIHTQQGSAVMADPSTTQTAPASGLIPFAPGTVGFDVHIEPIDVSGNKVAGSDPGYFEVTPWFRYKAGATYTYVRGTVATVGTFEMARESELPPNLEYGVAVTSVVIPGGSTGFRVLARRRT